MTKVRANNNDLWMQLAHIAYVHEPGYVKAIIRRIAENDAAVVDLWKQLADTPDGST